MADLLDNPSFSYDRFVTKLKNNREMLYDCSNKAQYIDVIERLYNHYSRDKVNLRFWHSPEAPRKAHHPSTSTQSQRASADEKNTGTHRNLPTHRCIFDAVHLSWVQDGPQRGKKRRVARSNRSTRVPHGEPNSKPCRGM